MSAFDFEGLLLVINNQFGVHDVACPLCGPDRRSSFNQRRKVLRVWYESPGFIGYACARCGEKGHARERGASTINHAAYARLREQQEQRHRKAAADRLDIALALWRSRQPLRGTIAETYLREARGYTGSLPPTLGFLPARGEYPAAMIAAFGMADEPEPGVIVLPEEKVVGVHLTRLAPDGSDRDRGDKAKIMIGFSAGSPIVLSPPTDGLALIVAEGIESALSGYEATGLCAWAAGCASRLPGIARSLPTWAESITIMMDDDPDGYRHAQALARAANARGIEVLVFGEMEAMAA
jgi:hypothetical protein